MTDTEPILLSEENVKQSANEVLNAEIPSETLNEFSYLDKGGFSSEKYKIEIRGLPKYYGINEFKKLLTTKLELKLGKVKTPRRGSHWLYVCFQNEEDRTKAITALHGYSWKGKNLSAQIAQPAPDPLIKKRKQSNIRSGQDSKKKKADENKSQDEKLKDTTTPYWNIPYEEQVKMKETEIKKLMSNLDNEIWKSNYYLRKSIENKRKQYNGLSWELKPMKRAKKTEGYRNKCEFTVGIDEETGLATVGFRLSSYVTGCVGVAPVDSLIHITDTMKKAVLIFQEFIRTSELKPFSPVDYSGNWRQLTVRQSMANGDIMLIVGIHPQELSEEQLEVLKQDLVKHFSVERKDSCQIRSLYIQHFVKRKPGEDPSKPIHLMGATHISDKILGLNFRISPEAFFQINTEGAEALYESAIEMSMPRNVTTVVDICCGTGTIGLCFAKHCRQVLGLELIPEAVNDAKANAELNGIKNCDFFAGRAEDILPAVLSRAMSGDVIAIVDPPRAGLHMRAVTQLRNIAKLNRLVYISCNPAAAMKNFTDLARASSKTLRGAPFLPVCALPVDLFPHTKHVELAVLFQRLNVNQIIAPTKEITNPPPPVEVIKPSDENVTENNTL